MRSLARRATALAALTGLVAVAVAVPATAGAVPSPGCAPVASPADESALTAMINQTRRAQGVTKLARDRILRSAGRRKSMEMASGGAFAHAASGKLPWARGRAAGQNIAAAASAGAAYQAMLQSPGHRQNLLESAWRYTGVGAVVGCDGVVYVTINLMAP